MAFQAGSIFLQIRAAATQLTQAIDQAERSLGGFAADVNRKADAVSAGGQKISRSFDAINGSTTQIARGFSRAGIQLFRITSVISVLAGASPEGFGGLGKAVQGGVAALGLFATAVSFGLGPIGLFVAAIGALGIAFAAAVGPTEAEKKALEGFNKTLQDSQAGLIATKRTLNDFARDVEDPKLDVTRALGLEEAPVRLELLRQKLDLAAKAAAEAGAQSVALTGRLADLADFERSRDQDFAAIRDAFSELVGGDVESIEEIRARLEGLQRGFRSAAIQAQVDVQNLAGEVRSLSKELEDAKFNTQAREEVVKAQAAILDPLNKELQLRKDMEGQDSRLVALEAERRKFVELTSKAELLGLQAQQTSTAFEAKRLQILRDIQREKEDAAIQELRDTARSLDLQRQTLTEAQKLLALKAEISEKFGGEIPLRVRVEIERAQLAAARADFDNSFSLPFAQTLSGALRGAILESQSAVEALGNFSRGLFENFVGDASKKLQDGLQQALTSAFGAGGGALGGALTGLLGLGGLLFSKGAKSNVSASFAGVNGAIQSTQAARGIISGPQSVAVAALGSDLQRALVPTNLRLDRIISILSSFGQGGGRGAPVLSAAGKVAV